MIVPFIRIGDCNVISSYRFFQTLVLIISRFSYSAKGNLSISWSVLQPNKDIAGFHVSVRNSINQIVVEHHVPYDRRTDSIAGNEICQGYCKNLELCVLSKNSHGSINRWFDSQCLYLPNDLEQIRGIYTQNSNQIYYIHSVRKHIRNHYGYKTHMSSRSSPSVLNIPIQIQFFIVIEIALIFYFT